MTNLRPVVRGERIRGRLRSASRFNHSLPKVVTDSQGSIRPHLTNPGIVRAYLPSQKDLEWGMAVRIEKAVTDSDPPYRQAGEALFADWGVIQSELDPESEDPATINVCIHGNCWAKVNDIVESFGASNDELLYTKVNFFEEHDTQEAGLYRSPIGLAKFSGVVKGDYSFITLDPYQGINAVVLSDDVIDAMEDGDGITIESEICSLLGLSVIKPPESVDYSAELVDTKLKVRVHNSQKEQVSEGILQVKSAYGVLWVDVAPC